MKRTIKGKRDIDQMGFNKSTVYYKIHQSDNMQYIRSVIGDSLADDFERLVYDLSENKKQSISRDQIAGLCKLDRDKLTEAVGRALLHPQSAKQILNEYMPWVRTKVIFSIPAVVNDWLNDKAIEECVSKSDVVEYFIMSLYTTGLAVSVLDEQ